MIKKINRGLGRKDFEMSRREGRVFQTPLFAISVVKTLPPFGHLPLTGQVEHTQIGFVISKKISKRAVDRNKIKRKLAEVIKNKIPEGFKIVILVRKNILEAKIEDIDVCWKSVYEKISS